VCHRHLASRSGDRAAAWRPGGPPGADAGRAPGQRRPRRGQIMVLFALMVPAIIAMIGLAVDGGRLLAERRRLQAAADAAAWAAVSEVLHGTPTNAEAVARWYLAQNGYTTGGDTTVTVAQPPTTGPNAGRSDAVQVTVQRAVTLTLAQIVHPEPITVGAGATGGPTPAAAPYGLLALNATSGGIDVFGTSGATVQTSSAASNYWIDVRGSGRLIADELITAHRGIRGTVQAGRGTDGAAPVIPDPFSRLPAPPVPGVTWSGLRVLGSGQSVNAQPGHWTDDLWVLGTGNQVTLAPGVYYFDQGASLNIFGFNNRVVGNGVLLYFAQGSTLNLGGGADLVVSAPTAPPYTGGAAGLVVFAARDNTTLIILNGGTNTTLTGTLYAPAAPILAAGGSAAGIAHGQLLADSFLFAGTSTILVRYDLNAVATPPRPTLLE
jgi:Flp pilus assembly protein TadG